jgi:hypothetical protein
MSDTQFLTILGTIWIAPHMNNWYGQMVGLIFLCGSVAKGLGVI